MQLLTCSLYYRTEIFLSNAYLVINFFNQKLKSLAKIEYNFILFNPKIKGKINFELRFEKSNRQKESI